MQSSRIEQWKTCTQTGRIRSTVQLVLVLVSGSRLECPTEPAYLSVYVFHLSTLLLGMRLRYDVFSTLVSPGGLRSRVHFLGPFHF